MNLETWETRYYKSIEEGQTVDLDDTNVLIGPNNSGKSSVIDALHDYRKAFPVAQDDDIDEEWISKRMTRERDISSLQFNFTFRLSDAERNEFRRYLDEEDLVSERESDRWEDNTFRTIEHELTLRPPIDTESSVEGLSNMYTHYEGSKIPLREGDIEDKGTEYINFNKLGSEEMNSNRRHWVALKDIIKISVDSWQFVDAFRRPENLADAAEHSDLNKRGDNLSQVLLTLVADNDDRFSTISKKYADIMEGIDRVKSPLRDNKTTVAISEQEFDGDFDLSEISAGSKEILTLITQIVLASEGSDMLLIEEPELHLHPGAQRAIFQFILDKLDVDGGPQVVISTHSSAFVDHDRVDNIISVKRSGKTQLSQSTEEEVHSDLKELGYRYSGMLQSDAVIIVEGTTDKTILKAIAAEKYNFDFKQNRIGIADMENSAKLVRHSRSLVKILSIFDIPYLFICDSDIPEHIPTVDADEVGDLSPTATEGKLKEYINRNGDDIWWDEATIDKIHVWGQVEIEAYLLSDKKSVKDCFDNVDRETIDEILLNEDLDPDEKLEEICEANRPYLDDELDGMDKKTDTSDLAHTVSLDEIPAEFHDVMEEIAGLVGKTDVINERRP